MNYSGFGRRLGAALIDGIIMILPSLAFGGSMSSISGSIGLNLILGLVYYPVFESSALCGTPGKALLKMVVVSESGDRLTFKGATVRFFCRYISVATCYIGYFMQLFTQKRQTLHDMLSESVVIDREMPDMNFFAAWKDQFKSVVNSL